jgi:heme-degrading monooxygenase HmoA
MNHHQPNSLLRALGLLVALATACGDATPTETKQLSTPGHASDDAGPSPGAEAAPEAGATADAFAACSKGVLEADLGADAPLNGPGVDPDTGRVRDGNYVLATTYLAIPPERTELALELGGPVVESLSTMNGLVAFSVTQSRACGTLRTLTVWETEEDMVALVMSPAHVQAMARFGEVNRGDSATVAWQGAAAEANWEVSAERLAALGGGAR